MQSSGKSSVQGGLLERRLEKRREDYTDSESKVLNKGKKGRRKTKGTFPTVKKYGLIITMFSIQR